MSPNNSNGKWLGFGSIIILVINEDKILEQVKLQNNAQEDIAGKILKLK